MTPEKVVRRDRNPRPAKAFGTGTGVLPDGTGTASPPPERAAEKALLPCETAA